jgi:hypothetical protein
MDKTGRHQGKLYDLVVKAHNAVFDLSWSFITWDKRTGCIGIAVRISPIPCDDPLDFLCQHERTG